MEGVTSEVNKLGEGFGKVADAIVELLKREEHNLLKVGALLQLVTGGIVSDDASELGNLTIMVGGCVWMLEQFDYFGKRKLRGGGRYAHRS